MWNSLRVSIYTTPEYRPQEFAGEEFYFATIEEFEIAIDNIKNYISKPIARKIRLRC
jgi:guanylate kinase